MKTDGQQVTSRVSIFCLGCSCSWPRELNFCQSIIVTWFSHVPSPPIPNTTIPFYFRLLKLSMLSPSPLTARSTMMMWGSTLELRWGRKNVSKMTLDIRNLKNNCNEIQKKHACPVAPVLCWYAIWQKIGATSKYQVHSIAHTQREERSLWEW